MFRFLMLLATLLPAAVMAQSPELGTQIEDEFKVTAVPEKWKTESAVIIGQKTEYLFSRVVVNRTAAVVRIKEYVHKRIRLQDKNALEKFSTFYYVTMGADGKATYTIIKADGKEINVDMKTAIEEEKDVPAIYRPIFMKMNIKSMKIAIPDLEVGDIIDYTVKSTLDWDMRQNGIEFSPFIFSLGNTYPTMFQQYRFTMADGMKVRYRAYNGAPNIKFDAKASVYGDKNSYLSYYFLDRDRQKQNEERWSLDYRNTPTVKFRVVLLADNDDESKGLGQATVDRSGLDINDVYKRYAGAGAYMTPTVTSLVGYTVEYIAKKKVEGLLKTEADVIRETYYCLRKVFLEMYYKGPVHSELEKYMTGKKLYKKVLAAEKKDVVSQKEEKEDEIRINGVAFATALRTALAAQGVQAELFVYVPRKFGSWRDAIFMEELDFMLRVRSKGKLYYLEAFNNFDAFATQYPYLENAEGYAIGYQEANQYYRATIPAASPAENVERQEFRLSLNEAMDLVKTERTSWYLGAEKLGHVEQANLDRAYLDYDFDRYFNVPQQKGKKKDDAPVVTSPKYDDPDREQRRRERMELFEKELKGEFDLDRYEQFELIKDGRYGDTAWLQYRERFTLKKLLSKAGRNYVLEIGKLIGGQIKLEESERQRQGDVWVPYARTIENTMVLDIPNGYTVEGFADLVKNVDNESGAFISTARVEDNKLIVTTRKVYKKSFDKKEAWANYIAFLDAAYQFSQTKVVLKKK